MGMGDDVSILDVNPRPHAAVDDPLRRPRVPVHVERLNVQAGSPARRSSGRRLLITGARAAPVARHGGSWWERFEGGRGDVGRRRGPGPLLWRRASHDDPRSHLRRFRVSSITAWPTCRPRARAPHVCHLTNETAARRARAWPPAAWPAPRDTNVALARASPSARGRVVHPPWTPRFGEATAAAESVLGGLTILSRGERHG